MCCTGTRKTESRLRYLETVLPQSNAAASPVKIKMASRKTSKRAAKGQLRLYLLPFQQPASGKIMKSSITSRRTP
jgi:hypothetical protein